MGYNNYVATYDEHLALDNKLKTHQRHLQFLAIETCKPKNKLNSSFMWKIYKEKNIRILGEGVLSLHFKRKHLEIWNKFINYQKKSFVE